MGYVVDIALSYQFVIQ